MKFVLYFLIFIPVLATAQFGNQDFGLWSGIGVEKKLAKGLKFAGDAEIRTEDNSTTISQYFIQVGAKYKLNKHFSAGVFWRPKAVNDYDQYQFQNRLMLDVKGKIKFGDLSVQLRNRIQQTFQANDLNPAYERVRLKLILNLPNKIEMFVQDEFFFKLNHLGGGLYDKNRIGFGLEHEIKKDISIGLTYLRINEVNVYYPLRMNVIRLKLNMEI